MAIQYLAQGSRKTIVESGQSGKFNIGLRFGSELMDIHTVIDLAVVCKSKGQRLNVVWYGNPDDETGFIHDDTINCQGSAWKDDDLRFTIDFAKAKDIERISIVTNILWGKNLSQHYGLIQRASLHVFSFEKNEDILIQEIQCNNHSGKTGMIWLEIYPFKDQWKVRAIENSCVSKSLAELSQIAGNYL